MCYVCACVMCACALSVCVHVLCVCVATEENSSSEVLRCLEGVATYWMGVGISLGLNYDLLEPLDGGNAHSSLAAVVRLWLGRRYDSSVFGEPSWRKLVEVVGQRGGACNPSLAESIAKHHQGEWGHTMTSPGGWGTP